MTTEKNKEAVYIVNQPKHLTLSIFVVGNEYPIPKDIHNLLNRINEVSDIIFVFSDKFFPKSSTIDKDKFSKLYEACGWISSSTNIFSTILKIMKYSKEVFDKPHLTYLLANLSDLSNVNFDTLSSNLEKIQGLGISNPMLRIYRKTTDQFYEIYKKKESPKKSLIEKLACNVSNALLGKKEKEESCEFNMYSVYSSDTKIIRLTSTTVNLFFNLTPKDCPINTTFEEYVNSFECSDFRNVLCSLIRRLNLKIVDEEV